MEPNAPRKRLTMGCTPTASLCKRKHMPGCSPRIYIATEKDTNGCANLRFTGSVQGIKIYRNKTNTYAGVSLRWNDDRDQLRAGTEGVSRYRFQRGRQKSAFQCRAGIKSVLACIHIQMIRKTRDVEQR